METNTLHKTFEKEEIIPEHYNGLRLDQTIAKIINNFSRNTLKEWILKKYITVNNKSAKPRQIVSTGDLIKIHAHFEEVISDLPLDMSLDVKFEDDSLLILNKPVGLTVHPGAGQPNGTLMNAVLFHYPENKHIPRAGIIHRLDKDTSGLIIIAKQLTMHNKLVKLMQNRKIYKYYMATIHGRVISGSTINKPIGRHPKYRVKMAVVKNGKEAITHYRVQTRFNNFTTLKIEIETGRTHQIRVHLSHLKYPIIGDKLYGGHMQYSHKLNVDLLHALENFNHQALHAYRIKFDHPLTNELIDINVDPPKDFQNIQDLLAKYNRYENK